MANIILGKVAITWKGEWSASNSYSEQDVVRDGADTYICIEPDGSTMGAQPSATAGEWELFAQGTSDISTTKGDLIVHNGAGLARLPIGNENDVLSVDLNGVPVWIPKAVRSSQRVRHLVKFDHMYRNGYEQYAIMEDGSLKHWGYGGWYGGGNGGNSSNLGVPKNVAFPLGFPGIKEDPNECTFWAQHAYVYNAIDENGHLWTWGRYGHDSIYSMTGTNGDQWIPLNLMEFDVSANAFNPTDGLQSVKAIAMCGGQESYCAAGVLGTDGRIYMCGYNGHGQLGTGDTSNYAYFTRLPYFHNLIEDVKESAPGTKDIVKFRMGRTRYTNCAAIDASGDLHMWGYNGDYQLGNGNSNSTSNPFQLVWNDADGNQVILKDVFPVYHSTYALDTQDRLWYWGSDYYGNSGLGVNTGGSINQSNVTPTLTISNVAQFATIDYNYPNCYVLLNDGTVHGTGYNGYGQLGIRNGDNQSSWTEMDLSMLKTGETVQKIFCGGNGSYHSFGLLTNQGRVYTCGYNGYGQLGVGNSSNWYYLQEVPCRDEIVEATFAGHDRYTNLQVRLADGQMLICGCGDNNQLATEDGEEYWTLSPVRF